MEKTQEEMHPGRLTLSHCPCPEQTRPGIFVGHGKDRSPQSGPTQVLSHAQNFVSISPRLVRFILVVQTP